VLRGVLKRAKRWQRFADEIKPLKKNEEAIGRVLAHEEKLRLVKIAGAKPAWGSAYFAAILSLNTTCRGCELKGIRWRDVDFLNGTVTIRRSKTAAGHRMIPLNRDAMKVVMAMHRRAEKLGEVQLDHYVFYACENGNIDTAKPQTRWRTAWRQLTRAIYCPACRTLQSPADVCKEESCRAEMRGIMSTTAGLRFHDLRHHAITELAESQTSESVIMGIAGHVSRKMLDHYSHIRMKAKRTALDGLSTGGTGYDTNHVTKRRASFENRPASD
jgi:integrase